MAASRFKRLNKYLLDSYEPLLVIDIPSGVQEKTKDSSYNQANAQAIIVLLSRILSTKTPADKPLQPHRFCVVTFFSAQKELLQQEMTHLHEQNPALGVDRIQISTIEDYNGDKLDVVFLDLVAVDDVRCLQDAEKLDYALSLADCVYVVVSFDAVLDQLHEDRRNNRAFEGHNLLDTMAPWNNSRVRRHPRFIEAHLRVWQGEENLRQVREAARIAAEEQAAQIASQDNDAGKGPA